MQDISNESLMIRYSQGDFAAFEMLYERNKGGVYRYLSRQLHDNNLVDDLFQEVWGQVIKNANTYAVSAKFTTWLYTIARHKVIDHVRHVKTVSQVFDKLDERPTYDSDATNGEAYETDGNTVSAEMTDSAANSSAEKSIEQAQQSQAIAHCMGKLPLHHLDSFLLKEEGGLSAPQIAEIANISLEASKSRLKTAYRLLRTCLQKTLGLDPAHQSVGENAFDAKDQGFPQAGEGV